MVSLFYHFTCFSTVATTDPRYSTAIDVLFVLELSVFQSVQEVTIMSALSSMFAIYTIIS